MMTMKYAKQIEQAVRDEAAQLRQDAGYAGEWGDRGATELLDQLEAWLAGLRGEVPKVFKAVADTIHKKNDPDWQTYLRLKNKFGE